MVKGAAKSLEQLDDELHKKYECKDFIDTVPYKDVLENGGFDQKLLIKTLLGPIVKKHDRQKI